MRKIEPLAGDIAPPEHFGPVPELRWLPIDRLVVDETYQRPLLKTGLANAARIAENFNWLKFGPVIVSPVEGGAYAIVDGQHRATAARTIGVSSVPCLILQADRKQQAAAFDAINGVVTVVTKEARLKAQLAAGDPRARRIKDVCDAAGVSPVWYKTAASTLKPRQTCAVDRIARLIDGHGDAIVVLALRMIVASAADKRSDLLAGIIVGVVETLADRADLQREQSLGEAFGSIHLLAAWERACAESRKRAGVRQIDAFKAELLAKLGNRIKRMARA